MSRRTNQRQGLQREGERRRATDRIRRERGVAVEHAAAVAATKPAPALDPAMGSLASGRRIAGQAVQCGRCGQPIVVQRTGRMPKWCSQVCRQRAWEHARAAQSGQAAVRVVDRYVAAVPNDGAGWIAQLGALAEQITNKPGPIGDRDLDQLAAALEVAQAALATRAYPARIPLLSDRVTQRVRDVLGLEVREVVEDLGN